MAIKPSLHSHAINRLNERYALDEAWLLQELENGRFVWLKGSGDSGNIKKVRSGHLIYIPNRDEYCVVIMDDRSRLAITVLTEDMALRSSWAKSIDKAAKLRAKRIVLGEEEVNDSNFLRLYAEERGELSVNIRVRTVSYDWKPIILTLLKISIKAEQIDPKENHCTLTESQAKEISTIIEHKVATEEIRPYCELFVSTGKGKAALISNKISQFYDLEIAGQIGRWREP